MRKIISWFRDYHSGRPHWQYYLITIAYTGIFVALNEIYEIQDVLVRGRATEVDRWLAELAVYALAYYPVFFLYCATHKAWHLARKWEFWAKTSIPIVFYAWTSAWSLPLDIAHEFFGPVSVYFARRCINNLLPILFTCTIFLVFKLLYDRNRDGFYGLGNTGFDVKPYIYLLLALAPFIVAVAPTEGFQATYPKYRGSGLETQVPEAILVPIYEICYAVDFIQVEWLFRGLFIVGLSRVIGPACLLPMCTFYCIVHFGKPLGETISSFFGGYILGILAMYSRNILGGVLIHVGIAWLMEAAAFAFKPLIAESGG